MLRCKEKTDAYRRRRASRSHSIRVRMSPSRMGPYTSLPASNPTLTFLTMLRLLASMKVTRTWA